MAEELLLNLITVFLGIAIIPFFANKIGIPIIVAEIIFGIVIGVSLFDMLPEHSMIEFFASFGLVYLMFLAGLHIDFGVVKEKLKDTVVLALFSIVVSFASGALIASAFGVNPLLLGAIISTTSLGLVMPLTKELVDDSHLLTILLGSVVLVDILSIFALAFSLAYIGGALGVSFLYSLFVIIVLFVIPWAMNKFNIGEKIEEWLSDEGHFDMEVRLAFALIITLGAVSGELGFHLIMGAFIAGLIISEITPQSSLLERKLESFGYGFFIPLFFIFTGAQVDLAEVFLNLDNLLNLVLLIGVGIACKIVGVFIASKFLGYSNYHGLSFAFFHTSRLSLIVAAAQIGRNEGLIGQELYSMLVLFALSTAIVGPLFGKKLFKMHLAKTGKSDEEAAAEAN